MAEEATARSVTRVRIALIDDDNLFREALGLNLSDEGYDVVSMSDGQAALTYFETGGSADIILLDWRMPGIDGIQVLHRLRSVGIDLPVIFLTVLSDQIYEEAALAGGAIDFVEKSRSFTILLRRIQIIEQGLKSSITEEGRPDPADFMELGPLQLDMAACRASWRGQMVDLTVTEFKIVSLLARRADTDLSYREIYDLVRGAGFIAGYGDVGYRSNVRAFIKRIRQKFRAIDPTFDQIRNYAGFGYHWAFGRSAG